ncbi:MAG: hypothetical protein JKY98_05115 [Gammaproteobacteria bacterium]|nr:hypothetical protein [Gammaproteobacteria bacterium]
MATKRAPNCPSLSLLAAIEKLERIYVAEGKNTFSGEVAVRLMHYNGLNGASRRTLGAIRSFGLIIGRGSELVISDDAVTIIADEPSSDQTQRQESLLRALRFNRVFADLNDRFGQGSTIINISSYLQKNYGFKSGAARKTAKNYRESASLIKLDNNPAAGIKAIAANPATSLNPHPTGSTGPSLISPEEERSSANYRQDAFALGEGFAILKWPKDLSPDSFEDFTDWLLLMHRKIGRDVNGGRHITLEKIDNTPERI